MYDDSRDNATPGDETAAQLGTLFTLALEDEPESTVTAASVLREVREERAAARWTFGDWLLGGGWKWGGAVVAAAALVGAVVVLPPMMGGGSADSATAGASAEMAQAYDSADEAADGAAPADAGADGSDQAFAMADSGDGDAADSAESEQAPAAPSAKAADQPSEESAAASAEVRSADSGEAGSGDSDSDSGEAAEEAGSAADDGVEQPEVGGPEMAAMPGLGRAQLDAARAALPGGAVASVRVLGGNPGGVVGNLLVLASGGSVQIVVESPHAGQAFVDTERQRERGDLVAEVARGGVRVTVSADRAAQSSLSQADVDRIAAAVQDAS